MHAPRRQYQKKACHQSVRSPGAYASVGIERETMQQPSRMRREICRLSKRLSRPSAVRPPQPVMRGKRHKRVAKPVRPDCRGFSHAQRKNGVRASIRAINARHMLRSAFLREPHKMRKNKTMTTNQIAWKACEQRRECAAGANV